jgi:hypothetical protein
VSTRLGRTISDAAEIAQVNAWISDIEGVIIERIPDLVALVTAGEIAAATVVRVECQAVLRKIKNPDGKKDERGDDYSYGLNPEYAKGELFLTDEEWASLATSTSETAFTIAPSGLRDADGDWTL